MTINFASNVPCEQINPLVDHACENFYTQCRGANGELTKALLPYKIAFGALFVLHSANSIVQIATANHSCGCCKDKKEFMPLSRQLHLVTDELDEPEIQPKKSCTVKKIRRLWNAFFLAGNSACIALACGSTLVVLNKIQEAGSSMCHHSVASCANLSSRVVNDCSHVGHWLVNWLKNGLQPG